MHRKWFAVLSIISVVAMLCLSIAPAVQASASSKQLMPPEPDKIAQMLNKNGKIPANARPELKEAIVSAYIKQKMNGKGEDQPNPLAKKQLDAKEDALNHVATADLRGRKLGNTQAPVSPSTPQFKELYQTDKLLLILVQFSDQSFTWTPVGAEPRTSAGPVSNKISQPDNDFDLWVPDFSTQHYEDMLFTPGGWKFPSNSPRYAGEHRGSMYDYYLTQSYGQYTIEGKAYGWFTVDKPEAYYGDDSPTGGNDNLRPGITSDLIADAVNVINAKQAIDWSDYDNDGNCVVDHPLFIHAGVDQSGGGGAQGDDAIWAHSSSVNQEVAKTANCPDGLFIQNYTIMPEDGGVGVFAHEFGHDLGLPDEYDTIYSGRGDNVGFWSLMSSGSWLGRPAQTQPSDISIWGRMALGWVNSDDNMVVTNLESLTKAGIGLRLEQSERWGGDKSINAIRVNLPPKLLFVNTPHSGSSEWFGGKGDLSDTTLRRTVDLTGKSSALLSFWTWYDIEAEWDFGFVQISADNGATWKSLPIEGTSSVISTDGMPDIAAQLPGFTGNSGGWVQKIFDLKDYVGQSIQLQFRYMTDWGTSMAGFFIDDILVTADGGTLFSDTVETEDPAWAVDGWTRDAGSSYKAQYYLLEWRNLAQMETKHNETSIVNFDNGLTNAYQHDPYSGYPNQPKYFSYNPGLLIWYRDMTYSDNWTGVHPGGGYLLVVDAHSNPLLRAPYLNYGSLPWNNRVQTYDSTFSLSRVPTMVLSYWNVLRNYVGANANPIFDGTKLYWSQKAPDNAVITPKLGILFRVLGQAEDGSAALIGLGAK